MLVPVRTVAPAVDVVSLNEAKAHLRVEHTAEDTLITAMVAAATQHLDGWSGVLGRCLVTQTWRQAYSGFPAGSTLRLPLPDVQSVTLSYTDPAGAPQTVSAADYPLVNDVCGGAVVLASGASWPSAADRPDAVSATFVAGYGNAAAVPAPIKAAILLHVGTLYENRKSVTDDAMAVLPLAYDALIAPYRKVGV